MRAGHLTRLLPVLLVRQWEPRSSRDFGGHNAEGRWLPVCQTLTPQSADCAECILEGGTEDNSLQGQ